MNVRFNTRCALVSIYGNICVHFGVKTDAYGIYKMKNGEKVEVECDRIWGRASDRHDPNIKYFGLGPLLLVCW